MVDHSRFFWSCKDRALACGVSGPEDDGGDGRGAAGGFVDWGGPSVVLFLRSRADDDAELATNASPFNAPATGTSLHFRFGMVPEDGPASGVGAAGGGVTFTFDFGRLRHSGVDDGFTCRALAMSASH